MDPKTLEMCADWPAVRRQLAQALERRAREQGMDASGLARRMGRKTFAIEQVLSGTLRSAKRYEAVALALGWSLEDALEAALASTR
jgi:IS4 transposase